MKTAFFGLGLALAASAALYAPAAAQDEGTFAARMMPYVEAQKPDGWTLRLDPADPAVIIYRTPETDVDGFVNLHRVQALCERSSERECDAISADFARKIFEAPKEFTRDDLRVIVRDQAYIDYIDAELPPEFEKPPMRRVGDDLYAILAFDGDETISLVRPSQLPGLSLSEDEAWDLGFAQSVEGKPAIPAMKSTGTLGGEEIYYLTALVYDLPRWGALAEASGADFYMAIPSQFEIDFGTASDAQLPAIAAATAQKCDEAMRCISPNVYRFREGRWVIANK
ncbi:hypothetical protein [Paraurantiacibacter namhicola]|uniref:DUF1444 family protein n=1 Tax=Paraurantiacibacter namhicola TaxID=645517 RepID=A0A1C7D702_9SPHN|nr:hypothetical protein [Paraurantiacibacter namhicola]ANU07101.1 hypothetical protein A6F65_00782 [Paraurantiacibacter namhicola]